MLSEMYKMDTSHVKQEKQQIHGKLSVQWSRPNTESGGPSNDESPSSQMTRKAQIILLSRGQWFR